MDSKNERWAIVNDILKREGISKQHLNSFDEFIEKGLQEILDEIGDIEIAPLAFMRGRTLDNAFVILDEAQNTTPAQMKMFLTRMGMNAKFMVTGDPGQVDLPKNIINKIIKIGFIV